MTRFSKVILITTQLRLWRATTMTTTTTAVVPATKITTGIIISTMGVLRFKDDDMLAVKATWGD